VERRILEYFDLSTIAALDGVLLTQNALGQALFPNELNVDTTERIRKVTQPLAARVFTEKCAEALRLHAAEQE
jgi:hypothetical protein